MHPVAYLRCEMKARDLKSRLLIAAHLLKRGYPVVIGQFWAMNSNLGTMPKGCVLFSTSNAIQAANVKFYKMCGQAVVACDEEAISTAEHLIGGSTGADAIKHCDAYLAVNSIHAAAISAEYPEHAGKVSIAGTARADVLRSMKRGESPHTAPYFLTGPYVLINTAFGLINSVWATEQQAVDIYAAGMGWDLSKPEHSKIMECRLAYERETMVETKSLIAGLIKMGRRVVLRPHPSENQYSWVGMGGITVVHRSDPYPWLQHADAVIHSDSTIGIESALMGVPTLNLSPGDEWASRVNLRLFNRTVKSAQDALGAIESGLGKSDIPDGLCPHGAAEKTAEVIASFLPPPETMNGIKWNPMERSDVQREKFTVEPKEFAETAKEIFGGICGDVQGVVLDDSVFLLRPH